MDDRRGANEKKQQARLAAYFNISLTLLTREIALGMFKISFRNCIRVFFLGPEKLLGDGVGSTVRILEPSATKDKGSGQQGFGYMKGRELGCQVTRNQIHSCRHRKLLNLLLIPNSPDRLMSVSL